MDPVIMILLAAAATGGVTAVFAALLVLAERVLVNYGTCTIDINRGARRFDVAGGDPLLTVLRGQGVFLPSACGGRGTCAYCKCEVSQGGGPVAPTETPLLTDQEIVANIRISCQVKVRNDIAVTIPEELFAVRQFRGVIERIRDLTHDIKELRIALIEPETIDFVPGQYVQLVAPPYGPRRDPVDRAYSMSNPTSDNRGVETIIRLVPGGICTTWVFTALAEGDEVQFTGPFGDFRLSDTDREMVWIAGGSGMAPFWSILRDMIQRGVRRKTTYFFGAVQQRDLFLLDDLRRFERELDWFTFIPALSGLTDGDDWDGETGLITEVVGRHVPAGEDLEVYLCGSPGMIDAAIKVVQAKNVTDDRIFYDKFA